MVMVNTKPSDRCFEIYMLMARVTAIDRRYCKIFVLLVNTLFLHGRNCTIYLLMVNSRHMDIRYWNMCVDGIREAYR